MDFALELMKVDGVAAKSKIRVLPTSGDGSLDDKALEAANQAARDMFGANTTYDTKSKDDDSKYADCAMYQEHILPTKSIIQPGDLIVIFESFDNLTFRYAKPGDIFQNRNGIFPHDTMIGKPFGSIIRSTNNRGYGFVHVLKPTPELWARSLPHRTQIIHELDASMICYNLELRPNMIVCESGTGSGAMSHAILRSIAPYGKLYTHEFNEDRVIKAREEFKKNGVSHMVNVIHRDVCGKDDQGGGFLVGDGDSISPNKTSVAHAVMLDLPEPWLAVPYAAKILKVGGRIASYSPCVEQSQRCIVALKKNGFHTIKTMEFRLREYYVDEVDLSGPPLDKRPRLELDEFHHLAYVKEGDKSKSNNESKEGNDKKEDNDSPKSTSDDSNTDDNNNNNNGKAKPKEEKKSMVCTRPFNQMRGHTAFLTFATSGIKIPAKPSNNDETKTTNTDS